MASGGGSDLVIALARTRGPGPPARCGLLFRLPIVDSHGGRPVGADGRRKYVEREAVIAAVGALRTGIPILVAAIVATAIVARILARLAGFTWLTRIVAFATVLPLRPLLAFLTLVAVGRFAVGFDQIVLTLVLIGPVAALAPLVLEPRPAFAEDAEIMVRILQIIFGLDAIARELRVARQALVLFKQLSGVAALTVVLTVARLSATTPADVPLSTAAAPAATLSIVDQNCTSLTKQKSFPFGLRQTGSAHLVPAPDPLVPDLARSAKYTADCVGGGWVALYILRGGAGLALTPM